MKLRQIGRQWMAVVLALALVLPLLPAGAAQAQGDQRYYPETGHFLGGSFRIFFDQYGGLDVFGFPVTDEYFRAGDGRIVQFFQRARFELLVQPDGTIFVILGNVGSDYINARNIRFQRVPPVADTPNRRYFPETGHTLQQPFKAYWDANNGATFFGAPLSEQVRQDGRTVQFFERARLELNSDGSISRGLLGDFLAPCQQKIYRPSFLPPPGPQLEGDAGFCNRPDQMPMGTLSPMPVISGDRVRVLAIRFSRNEEISAWVNLPDRSVRNFRNPVTSADDNGNLALEYDQRLDDQPGTYSIVLVGVRSKRQLVIVYRVGF